MDAQLKISRTITRLVLSHPFFGSVALSVRVEQADIPTMATDGNFIRWGEQFVNDTGEEELLGVMAHEVLHIVFKHMLRRGTRDFKRWNIACDLAINPVLLRAGFKLPKDRLHDPQYDNLSAEAIYDRLPQDADEQMSDGAGMGEVQDAKGEDGQSLSDAEVKQMEADIDSKVMMAANAARAVGKLPADIQELVNRMKRSQIDYRDTMRRFFAGEQPDDYSMRRPQRKLFHAAGIIAPSISKIGVGNIVVGVDSSGSVDKADLAQFLGEMNAISEDMQPTSITVIVCDAKVNSVRRYEQGELIEDIQVGGRGGTLVTPVFDYIEDNHIDVDQMVYLTDLMVFDFPDEPHFPVLWVSCWEQAKPAPWGETIYLRAA
jgi:predicted metal-dependent peptidase